MFGYRDYSASWFTIANRRPTKFYPDRAHLERLIQRGIEIAGSMNKLARELGYRSRTHAGEPLERWLRGKAPVPIERWDRLVALVGDE